MVPTRSVRFRVTVIATVIVAIVLTVVAVAIVIVQHRALTAAIDESLGRRADDLATIAASSIPTDLAGVDDDSAAQLTTAAGLVLVSSPNLIGEQPIGALPAGATQVIEERQLVGPDDTFRVLTRRIDSIDGPLLIHVATATDDVSDAVGVLRGSMMVAIPLAVAALAGAIWWMVGRALQPVEDIRRDVNAITETDLSRRVPVPSTGDEIERLAVTMNGMLERIEEGVSRLQQFVADASHELRTPLTRIRSELEVERDDGRKADWSATRISVLEEAVAMQSLVDDLLFLARSDAGRQPDPSAAVDLDDLVLSEADRVRTESGLFVDVSAVSAGQVVGERSQLRRMIGNLLGNAARYAIGRIDLMLREEGAAVVLTVADDGPGIAAKDQERVFNRFARTDEGRSRDDGGSGLGLAIVHDIVTRHRGEIVIDPHYSGGARFVVRLPRA